MSRYLEFKLGRSASSLFFPFAMTVWGLSYLLFLCYYPIKHFNFKAALTVTASLLLLVLGSLIISDFVFDETHTFELRLNYCGTDTKIPGSKFSCLGISGDVFVGVKVNCKITGLEGKVSSTELVFTHFNGSKTEHGFEDKISFIVPQNVAHVRVDTSAKSSNETLCASSSHVMTFTSYEDLKQQRREIGYYLIAMVSFILLSVPAIVNGWTKIFRK